ncbi:hypothetical protein ACQP3F_31185, partial [Escherichia coli]
KASLSRCQKIEITFCILSDHRLRLDINNRNNRECTNSKKLNNSPPSEKWLKIDTRKEIKDFLEVNENENTTYPNLWDTMEVV